MNHVIKEESKTEQLYNNIAFIALQDESFPPSRFPNLLLLYNHKEIWTTGQAQYLITGR